VLDVTLIFGLRHIGKRRFSLPYPSNQAEILTTHPRHLTVEIFVWDLWLGKCCSLFLGM